MSLCSNKQLCEWLGYERPADVERWLKEHDVPYTTGKGGLAVTTEEAVQNALFIQKAHSHRKQIEF